MAERVVPARRVTFEEFIEEYTGRRYEYVDGRAVPMGPEIVDRDGRVMVAPTKSAHGLIVGRLTIIIGQFVLENNLGEIFGAETGFLVDAKTQELRAADVAFYPRERLKEIRRGEWLPFPPALAVEVVSEHDRAAEVRRKARSYMAGGTRLLWIVYPGERVVDVYRPGQPTETLGAADTLDGGEVLPGFTAALGQVFAALEALGDGD
jgi:Uma2 family endonuclease